MPGKMARSDPRPSVRVTRGAGSGQHLASVLQEGRENAKLVERKSGAVRRSHAPRLRALPRYRQSGKAQARVTDDGWLLAEGCGALSGGSNRRTRLLDRPGAVADYPIARSRGVPRVAQGKPLRREAAAVRLHQEAGHREIPAGL